MHLCDRPFSECFTCINFLKPSYEAKATRIRNLRLEILHGQRVLKIRLGQGLRLFQVLVSSHSQRLHINFLNTDIKRDLKKSNTFRLTVLSKYMLSYALFFSNKCDPFPISLLWCVHYFFSKH